MALPLGAKTFSHLLISLGPSPTDFPGVAMRRVGSPCRYTVLRLGGSCSLPSFSRQVPSRQAMFSRP